MVTSALPKDGKSMFASSLARNAAAAGWRVLLIDCDFGCPTVAPLFGLERSAGLREILTGGSLGGSESAMHEPEPRLTRHHRRPQHRGCAGTAGVARA